MSHVAVGTILGPGLLADADRQEVLHYEAIPFEVRQRAYLDHIDRMSKVGRPCGGEDIRFAEACGVTGEQLMADVRGGRIALRQKALATREKLPAMSEAVVAHAEATQKLLDERDAMKLREHTPFALEQISRRIENEHQDWHVAREKLAEKTRFVHDVLQNTADPDMRELAFDLGDAISRLRNPTVKNIHPERNTFRSAGPVASNASRELRGEIIAGLRQQLDAVKVLLEKPDCVSA